MFLNCDLAHFVRYMKDLVGVIFWLQFFTLQEASTEYSLLIPMQFMLLLRSMVLNLEVERKLNLVLISQV